MSLTALNPSGNRHDYLLLRGLRLLVPEPLERPREPRMLLEQLLHVGVLVPQLVLELGQVPVQLRDGLSPRGQRGHDGHLGRLLGAPDLLFPQQGRVPLLESLDLLPHTLHAVLPYNPPPQNELSASFKATNGGRSALYQPSVVTAAHVLPLARLLVHRRARELDRGRVAAARALAALPPLAA